MSDLSLDPTGDKPKTDFLDTLANEQVRIGTQRGYLVALNNVMRNIYSGTVDPVTIADRRAKNKRARKARRINRQR